MAVLKLTDLLLLFLIYEVTSAYDCMNRGYLMNCAHDNPRVRIIKDDDHYKLTLCSNNKCIGDDELDWRISCNDVCDICKSLLGSQSSSMIKLKE